MCVPSIAICLGVELTVFDTYVDNIYNMCVIAEIMVPQGRRQQSVTWLSGVEPVIFEIYIAFTVNIIEKKTFNFSSLLRCKSSLYKLVD